MTEPIIPSINRSLCTRCTLCVTGCPENALVMSDQGPAFIEPITCTYCGECESLCPTGAIRAPMLVTWNAQ